MSRSTFTVSSLRIHVYDKEGWNEEDHPRAKNGEFATYGTGSAMKKQLEAQGFSKKKGLSPSGKLTYAGPQGVTITVHPPKGGANQSSEWTLYQHGNEVGKGSGSKSLQYKLTHGLGVAPAPVTPAAQPASAPQSAGWFKSHEKALSAGYEFKQATGGTKIYQKGEAKIIVKQDGEWISEAPGKQPKTGKTPEALEALLAGKPGAYSFYSKPPSHEELTKTKASKSQANEGDETFKKFANHRPQMTANEREQIQSYTSSGYQEINKCLRHKDDCNDHRVPAIKAYLDKCSIPEDVTVYRGISGDYAKILKSVVDEGTVFRDRGFVSTSTKKSFSDDWKDSSSGILMEISVKKGAKGASMSGVTSHEHEAEILFQRGSKFKIISFDRKTHHMKCELIQDDV